MKEHHLKLDLVEHHVCKAALLCGHPTRIFLKTIIFLCEQKRFQLVYLFLNLNMTEKEWHVNIQVRVHVEYNILNFDFQVSGWI